MVAHKMAELLEQKGHVDRCEGAVLSQKAENPNDSAIPTRICILIAGI